MPLNTTVSLSIWPRREPDGVSSVKALTFSLSGGSSPALDTPTTQAANAPSEYLRNKRRSGMDFSPSALSLQPPNDSSCASINKPMENLRYDWQEGGSQAD
jgi:hypothetical protein